MYVIHQNSSNTNQVFKYNLLANASIQPLIEVLMVWSDLYAYQKEKLDNQWQYEAPEVVSVEQFPAGSSSDLTNNRESNDESSSPFTEDRNHDIHVMVATAAAAEVATAAATCAAPKVVRLDGYSSQSKEQRAATLIQSYYRGYLVKIKSQFFLIALYLNTILTFVFLSAVVSNSNYI